MDYWFSGCVIQGEVMGNPANILILGAGSGDNHVAALEAAGYRCAAEPVETGILAGIEQHRPGVVLVSIAGTQDLEAIRTAKADSEAQRIPVAAIDIGAAPDMLANCREAGADDVFEDDIDERELVARMQALVRLGGMEAELVRRSATAGEFGIEVDTSIARPPDEGGGYLLVVGAEEGEIETLCPLLPNPVSAFPPNPTPTGHVRALKAVRKSPSMVRWFMCVTRKCAKNANISAVRCATTGGFTTCPCSW